MPIFLDLVNRIVLQVFFSSHRGNGCQGRDFFLLLSAAIGLKRHHQSRKSSWPGVSLTDLAVSNVRSFPFLLYLDAFLAALPDTLASHDLASNLIRYFCTLHTVL